MIKIKESVWVLNSADLGTLWLYVFWICSIDLSTRAFLSSFSPIYWMQFVLLVGVNLNLDTLLSKRIKEILSCLESIDETAPRILSSFKLLYYVFKYDLAIVLFYLWVCYYYANLTFILCCSFKYCMFEVVLHWSAYIVSLFMSYNHIQMCFSLIDPTTVYIITKSFNINFLTTYDNLLYFKFV